MGKCEAGMENCVGVWGRLGERCGEMSWGVKEVWEKCVGGCGVVGNSVE